jgi:hypothetical protein
MSWKGLGRNRPDAGSAGRARFTDDPATRRLAADAAAYTRAARYVLFELDVDRAASTVSREGAPVHRRWTAG